MRRAKPIKRPRASERDHSGTLPLDAQTGGVISPIVAGALCIKPRGLLTSRQAEKVDILKQALPIFACMRSLAMRFRGLLRGNDSDALDDWIRDALDCGIHAMQRCRADPNRATWISKKIRVFAVRKTCTIDANPAANRTVYCTLCATNYFSCFIKGLVFSVTVSCRVKWRTHCH
jgi:hypothetical protein